MPYKKRFGVRKWEQQFWRKPIIHPHLELYAADIDTTFAVYNKKYYLGKFMDAIRVAGAYSSIHLPWFPKRDILSEADKEAYAKGNKSSNWT